jgi:hypothetical protein
MGTIASMPAESRPQSLTDAIRIVNKGISSKDPTFVNLDRDYMLQTHAEFSIYMRGSLGYTASLFSFPGM